MAADPTLTISTNGETKKEAMAKVREAIPVTIEGLKAQGQSIPPGIPQGI